MVCGWVDAPRGVDPGRTPWRILRSSCLNLQEEIAPLLRSCSIHEPNRVDMVVTVLDDLLLDAIGHLGSVFLKHGPGIGPEPSLRRLALEPSVWRRAGCSRVR